MLRASTLTLRRPFSTSSSIWNIQRLDEQLQNQDASSSLKQPENSQSSEETQSHRPNTSQPEQSDTRNSKPESREPLTSYDLDLVKSRVREWTQQATISLRNRADDFTVLARSRFSQLGAELNKVTGYEEIEALKRGVVDQEERINIAREAARKAKFAYEEAVRQRSNSQREVNDLLQRKSTWVDSDVGRFTSLVRQDHLYEQEETRAKVAVEETEDAVDREFSQLMRTILARYHEEQVWSDKIRSASTYGSLTALGLNMLVFIMAILVVEPWKRRRLAQTFEAKIEELSLENGARSATSMAAITQQIENQGQTINALREELSALVKSVPETPAQMPEIPEKPAESRKPDIVVFDTFRLSQRQLEVAAVGTGAFVVGILSSLIFNR